MIDIQQIQVNVRHGLLILLLIRSVSKFLPKLDLSPLSVNKAKWAELIDFYDKKLEKLNKDAESDEERHNSK